MKKIAGSVLALCFALSMTACSAQSESDTQTSSKFEENNMGEVSATETTEDNGDGNTAEQNSEGKKQKRVLSQRVVNKYSGEKISETSFYENSALRIRTVYTDSENYVQTTYFDGGFVVRDFYENGVKISSTFSNGKGRGAN